MNKSAKTHETAADSERTFAGRVQTCRRATPETTEINTYKQRDTGEAHCVDNNYEPYEHNMRKSHAGRGHRLDSGIRASVRKVAFSPQKPSESVRCAGVTAVFNADHDLTLGGAQRGRQARCSLKMDARPQLLSYDRAYGAWRLPNDRLGCRPATRHGDDSTLLPLAAFEDRKIENRSPNYRSWRLERWALWSTPAPRYPMHS